MTPRFNGLAAFAGLGAAATALFGVAAWIMLGSRVNPAERERKRRAFVNTRGRFADAYVTDVRDDIIDYDYSIAGVDYNASQDISAIRELLPEDLSVFIGPATLKYVQDNPANSIVLCEEWSGLHVRPPAKAS